MLLSNSKPLSVLSMAIVMGLVGCSDSSGPQQEETTMPIITSDRVYGQGMCDLKIDLEDESYRAGVESLLTQNTSFTRQLKFACNQVTVSAGNFALYDFDKTSVDYKGNLIETYEMVGFASPQLVPGTTNEFLANLTMYLEDWTATGITKSGFVRGDISGTRVDFILTAQDKWHHGGFVFNKQEISFLARSNFDDTIDPYEDLINDILTPSKESKLHDIMYSYCALYTNAEKTPFIYNAVLDNTNKIENGSIKGEIVSTFDDISPYVTEAADNIDITKVRVKVDYNNDVSVIFDAQKQGDPKVYTDQVFNCKS